MKKLFLLFAFTCVLFISCKKNKGTYLVFGHFYGMCAGEKCVEIFKLTDSKLYEDTQDKYPSRTDFYSASYKQLAQQQFEDTKDLIGFFPSDLLNETQTVFGQPDAADQGGLYIEYYKDGIHKFWMLDNNKNNVPSKYHSFMDKMREKIDKLQ